MEKFCQYWDQEHQSVKYIRKYHMSLRPGAVKPTENLWYVQNRYLFLCNNDHWGDITLTDRMSIVLNTITSIFK
jgi:hypothetical protein